MHPFPIATKLHFLIGCELEQVCIGRWQIQFHFDKARIYVEGRFEHIDKSGEVRRHNGDEDRFSPIFLHHLFGQKIRLIEVEPLRLTLAFDGGDIIRIPTDESPYECGQIYDQESLLMAF